MTANILKSSILSKGKAFKQSLACKTMQETAWDIFEQYSQQSIAKNVEPPLHAYVGPADPDEPGSLLKGIDGDKDLLADGIIAELAENKSLAYYLIVAAGWYVEVAGNVDPATVRASKASNRKEAMILLGETRFGEVYTFFSDIVRGPDGSIKGFEKPKEILGLREDVQDICGSTRFEGLFHKEPSGLCKRMQMDIPRRH